MDSATSELGSVRFATTLRGYACDDVDAYLSSLRDRLGGAGSPPAGHEVRTAQFRLALRGYGVDQVDDFLERLAVELDATP